MGMISWSVYEYVKRNLNLAFPAMRDGHVLHFCCGVAAGVVAPTVMAPIEVSKTRLQIWRHLLEERGVAPGTAPPEAAYRNVFQVMSDIRRKEGMRAFFRGLLPSVLTRSLQWGLGFTSYEFVKKMSSKE